MNIFASDIAVDLQVNLNIEMYSGSTLIGSSKKRYAEKLKIVGITECPYTVPAEFLWKNNPTYNANLEYSKVY